MAQYLLIPGGQREKDDWDLVRAILEAHGHQTHALTLSDPQRSSLGDHLAQIRGLINERGLHDAVLAGHSYGGFLISGIAGRPASNVAKLVYVDSAIPRPGQSLWDVFEQGGVQPAEYGMPAWPPFIEPLSFDQALLDRLPKIYVHCLKSQFIKLSRDIPKYLRSRPPDENWRYFELDADHYCLLNQPQELANILLQA